MLGYPLAAITGLLATKALAGGLNVPLPQNNSFDYVVVGGGPAGLTVANRLSEDPNVLVLLLEAGDADNYPESIMIPYFQGAAGSVNGRCGGYNWCDQTVAQTYLDGATRTIPQGRGLGGGTLINAMLWTRGDRQDYDEWAALGNEGWDYDSMLEYFQRSETFNKQDSVEVATTYGMGFDESQHGFSGPQNVSFPAFQYPASTHFFAALNRMGVPTQPDAAAPEEKGAMYLPEGISEWNQSRADARRARWDPVAGRDNFYVSTGQHVRRVLFEGGCEISSNGNARAVGVEVSAGPDGRVWTATAAREVILAAGAIRTPQLLELSGIGDKDVVTRAGIQSRISLPGVGNNLQDHMLMHMSQAFNNESYVYPNIMQNQTINDWARAAYYDNRTGPYTFGPPNGNGFLSLPQISNRSKEIADQAATYASDQYLAEGLDQTVIEGYTRQRALLIDALRANNRAVIEFLQDNAGNTQVGNMRPLTRGSVHISNTDPFTYPDLDFRYGSDPADMAVMIDSLRFNDELFQQPELQILDPVQNDPPHAATDEQLQDFLNRALGTEYHPSCTAAMLPREHGGVVNSSLVVYGTHNLRIVDASIFPMVPSAHLEAVIYGVAERAADLIKNSGDQGRMPNLPLDQTMCTTASSSTTKRSDKVPVSYPDHNVYKREVSSDGSNAASSSDATTPVGDDPSNGLVGMVGGFPAVGYPNYNPKNTRGFNLNDQNRPASVGLPRGAALLWADAVIRGIIVDPLEGILSTINGITDEILGGLGPVGGLLDGVTDGILGGVGGALNQTVPPTGMNEKRFVA